MQTKKIKQNKEDLTMKILKGLLRTSVIFFLCLVLGLVIFRLDDVCLLFKDFYTQFSWGMVGTVFFTGGLTLANLFDIFRKKNEEEEE